MGLVLCGSHGVVFAKVTEKFLNHIFLTTTNVNMSPLKGGLKVRTSMGIVHIPQGFSDFFGLLQTSAERILGDI